VINGSGYPSNWHKSEGSFPVELLAGIEEWAAARDISRSKAIRVLHYRELARP
jgi:hypothetical protein